MLYSRKRILNPGQRRGAILLGVGLTALGLIFGFLNILPRSKSHPRESCSDSLIPVPSCTDQKISRWGDTSCTCSETHKGAVVFSNEAKNYFVLPSDKDRSLVFEAGCEWASIDTSLVGRFSRYPVLCTVEFYDVSQRSVFFQEMRSTGHETVVRSASAVPRNAVTGLFRISSAMGVTAHLQDAWVCVDPEPKTLHRGL